MTLEAPNKAALLEYREEARLVADGKAVLEQQRELLARELLDLIRQCETLQQEFERRFRAARRAIRLAVLRHGLSGLGGFRFDTTLPAAQWKQQNRFGTSLLTRRAVTPAPPPAPGAGWENSLELERAVINFHRLAEIAAELAPLQNNLARLSEVFRRIQRRVNALENILLPELQSKVKGMGDALDEMEREGLGLARLIKQRRGQ